MDLPLYVIPEVTEYAHSWVAMAAAAVSAAGAIVGNMQKNSEAQRQMEQYVIDMVAIDTNAGMAQEALISDVATITQTSQQRQLQVEMNEAADLANAKVSAAASGTSGQSVELTEIEIESSAGRAAGTIETQTSNFLAGIDQASRDIELSADAQRSNLEPLDTRGQLLQVFGAGLQGFLGGR